MSDAPTLSAAVPAQLSPAQIAGLRRDLEARFPRHRIELYANPALDRCWDFRAENTGADPRDGAAHADPILFRFKRALDGLVSMVLNQPPPR